MKTKQIQKNVKKTEITVECEGSAAYMYVDWTFLWVHGSNLNQKTDRKLKVKMAYCN